MLVACGSDDPPTPTEHPIDPLLCPVAPGPTATDTCSDEGAVCHYAGGCTDNCRCTDGAWACGDGGRFSCGSCASDVRCTAGMTCDASGGTCACGSDGVFECITGDAPPTMALPACPVDQPAMGAACAADQQVCHYIAGTCIFIARCMAGQFAIEEACGA